MVNFSSEQLHPPVSANFHASYHLPDRRQQTFARNTGRKTCARNTGRKHLSEIRAENLRRKLRAEKQKTFIRKTGRKKLPADQFSTVRQGASLFSCYSVFYEVDRFCAVAAAQAL